MTIKKCPSCQAEIHDDKKEQIKRKATSALLKSIQGAFPGLEATLIQVKDDCFKCYRKKILECIGPMAAELIGQQLAESEADSKPADQAIKG